MTKGLTEPSKPSISKVMPSEDAEGSQPRAAVHSGDDQGSMQGSATQ